MVIVEMWIALSLIFGGAIGYGVSQKNKDEKQQENMVEPEYWGERSHKKFMRECARQCRKSNAMFKSYEPLSGDCKCNGPIRRIK